MTKQAPFGYRFDEYGLAVPDENEQGIIQDMACLYLNGVTPREITEALADRGVTNKAGDSITERTVRKILNCGPGDKWRTNA